MSATSAIANPDVLLRRASVLLNSGRTGAAGPLLAALRRMVPASPELAHLSARLAMCENRLCDAAEDLDSAITAAPGDAALRKLRAELRLRCDDLGGAALDAAEAVVLLPSDPAAKALLGVILLQLKQIDDAVACLAEAVRCEPANPAFVQGLAAAMEGSGDLEGAAAVLDRGAALCPGAAALRSAAILLSMRRNDCDGAVTCAEEARRAGAVDACVFGLQGHALSQLGRHDEAAEAYREALKLAPEDPYVRHLVAASGTLPGSLRAPTPYLRAVFDGYASRFEAHIVALGYRIPGLVRGTLLRHLPDLAEGSMTGPVLDLGCGTGLVAVACSDLPLERWEGVDVSPRMLGEAAGKGVYAALHEADLVDWLEQDERRWPLILAADVFCYFGSLDEALARVHSRLSEDGLFVLSLEEHIHATAALEADDRGWALRQQGRYAHELRYVQAAARSAGLRVRELDRQVLRQEGLRPVPGFVVALDRAP